MHMMIILIIINNISIIVILNINSMIIGCLPAARGDLPLGLDRHRPHGQTGEF